MEVCTDVPKCNPLVLLPKTALSECKPLPSRETTIAMFDYMQESVALTLKVLSSSQQTLLIDHDEKDAAISWMKKLWSKITNIAGHVKMDALASLFRFVASQRRLHNLKMQMPSIDDITFPYRFKFPSKKALKKFGRRNIVRTQTELEIWAVWIRVVIYHKGMVRDGFRMGTWTRN